jgi:general secretion pathway protein J
MRNLQSQRAFTLIEIVVGMTLLALIVMILYGAFHLGHRAKEKAEARSEESQRLRSAGDILAGYIRSSYPYRSSLRDPAIFFSGEEDRLTFISALSSGMGGRGMSLVSVSWDGETGGRLVLEEEIPVRLEGQGAYKNRVVVSEGVREFRIDYMDSQSEEERWISGWDGRERKALPRAVRLSHRGKGGQEIQWVFPIMMSVLAP